MPPAAPTNVLAFDTAYGRLAACLKLGDEIHLLEENATPPRAHNLANELGSLMQQAHTQWRDLDAFAFGCGPGSFTGLRIGAATLAGLNSGLRRPILHISSLAITAAQAHSNEVVSIIEDARAGEAFYASYRNSHAVVTDRCLKWDEVTKLPAGGFVSHSEPAIDLPGWRRLPLVLSRSQALARVLNTLWAEGVNWQRQPRYPQPRYLQASQAERSAHV